VTERRRTIRNRGFTLIELLVVIAIIAILAAILFPVLGAAKERGRIAKCTSNMHQLALAVQMYADDWDDVRPAFLSELFPSYVADKSVYICPSDPWHGNTYWGPGDWEGGTRFASGVSYAYMPRTAFWDPLWEGANPSNTTSRGKPQDWRPIFGAATPMIFCWWHQQIKREFTEPVRTERKFPVLVALVDGSVRKCHHERLLPCQAQIPYQTNPDKYAKDPFEVLK
jgi:prepilin-type N-terminal cleavage/methylation domain-containing protein